MESAEGGGGGGGGRVGQGVLSPPAHVFYVILLFPGLDSYFYFGIPGGG